jgi:hypothetical protein
MDEDANVEPNRSSQPIREDMTAWAMRRPVMLLVGQKSTVERTLDILGRTQDKRRNMFAIGVPRGERFGVTHP